MMVAYLDEVKTMLGKIKDFRICQISREKTMLSMKSKAEVRLAKASAFDFISNRSIPLEFLTNPSTEVAKSVCQTEIGPTWMDDIIAISRMTYYYKINSKLVVSSTCLQDFAFSMEYCIKDIFHDPS